MRAKKSFSLIINFRPSYLINRCKVGPEAFCMKKSNGFEIKNIEHVNKKKTSNTQCSSSLSLHSTRIN